MTNILSVHPAAVRHFALYLPVFILGMVVVTDSLAERLRAAEDESRRQQMATEALLLELIRLAVEVAGLPELPAAPAPVPEPLAMSLPSDAAPPPLDLAG